ncbi:MAG TPA: tetratricopeptide repeat protein [Blastocatellia bacterium]|nr:tetratricopeptide repeat protein [Blastocatellia bacterium]
MKRLGLIVLLFFLGCSVNSSAAQAPSVERGRELLKQGNYKEAISVFTALVEKDSNDAAAVAGLARAQIETGDYANAEKKAKEFLNKQADNASIRNLIAEIQLETGRYSEAASEFDRAARDAKGAVWLQANLGRARALRAQGKEDEARPVLQEFVRYYNTNSPRSAEELTLIARALTYLEKIKDADALFKDALEADPTYIEAYISQGELYNEKYSYGDAASLFKDALKINSNSVAAHVGMAESIRFESTDGPVAAVERALAINPNHTGALALRAWLSLEADNHADASKAIDRALGVNPNSIEAISVRAAMFYLQAKKNELDQEIKRALAINPRAGELFDTLAHFSVITRRYADGVDFGRRAVDLSPRLWGARTQLGIQLMRIGRTAEGRVELERAFEGDPYNVWAKNTLDLLDSMREYQETIRGPFLIKSAPSETGTLGPYAAELLEEVHKKLTTKYRFTPRAPISVEMFPNHEDFAVRSLGLPGLGALGVCFGQVITMDSPSARTPGEYNWGGTLWHEFTHVITLQITDHKIPRWFSEGLSVYEERRARPGWGGDWSLVTLKAYADNRFVKIDDLDAAFTRPRAPDQVPLAYFQASLVCEYIEEKHGFDAILRMLALYKEGARTPDVFQRALSTSTTDFDRAFGDYLRAKTKPWLEALSSALQPNPASEVQSKEVLMALVKSRPNDFFAHLKLGTTLKSEGDADRAIEHLKRAAELFPFYGGEGNAYSQLAEIYEARGQKPEAAAMLQALTRADETNAEAFAKLARLRLATGDRAGAVEAIKQSFYINPFDAALHKLAGDVYLDQGNAAEAAKEYRVLVALDPPDKAQAHYDLARSLEAVGNRAEARREVLRSLEIAPGFEKAQELLLKLRGAN